MAPASTLLPLRPKHALFVAEYLIDLNGAQAAVRCGYSPKTARVIASTLLTKMNIKAAIEKGLQQRAHSLEIDQQRVLQEVAALAYSNHDHYTMDDDGNLVLADHAPRFASRAIAGVKRKKRIITNTHGRQIVEHELEYKLWSKTSALDKLMQHLGLFPKDTGAAAMPIEVNIVVYHAGDTAAAVNVTPQATIPATNGQGDEVMITRYGKAHC